MGFLRREWSKRERIAVLIVLIGGAISFTGLYLWADSRSRAHERFVACAQRYGDVTSLDFGEYTYWSSKAQHASVTRHCGKEPGPAWVIFWT